MPSSAEDTAAATAPQAKGLARNRPGVLVLRCRPPLEQIRGAHEPRHPHVIPSSHGVRRQDGDVEHVRMEPTSFTEWYGNWGGVAITVVLGGGFALALLWPRQRREWRNAGLLQAFLISLFTEMFGFPLTIYLLSSWLGEPYLNFGLLESHLWAWALAKVSVLSLEQAVGLVMSMSLVLLAVAAGLLAVGWWKIYQAKGELVTDGLYGVVRHPQYLGLILGVVAFLIQWPTLPTLVMGPILIVAYLRLARREEQALGARFGDRYRLYRQRVPGFLLL